MAFWQWVGLALAAAVACMVVRVQQPQLAGVCAVAAGLMLMAAGIMILAAALGSLQDVQQIFTRLSALGGLNEGYLSTLLKVLGMSFASELASQTCEDLGERGLALKVGLAGKLCVFAITAPLLMELLEMILELVP